ncbi:MAG TPA: hypothetical protein PLR20_07580 [Syntrophales bacterium]|nr:hypothetical protein [Syntrophales bacterium]HOX93319.1 hypothetical protein [Syntrophales bacterium]HPI56520.1 hypothetical protein [Syntrophales bacterium]HPN25059.1 hypothetical protein [Syntrophales bacterium]HQM29198.1 hypothetical protein [Syntrophales bacterium]
MEVIRVMKRQMGTMTFVMNPAPPFRLDYTVWAIRRRSINVIDRWDGTTWRRVHPLAEGVLEVQVTQAGAPEKPMLRVRVLGKRLPADSKKRVKVLLTRMLGVETELSAFYRLARGRKSIGALVERFRGVRLPRFPSVFEALVNGIACQQLSLTVGITLLNRLARFCGDRFVAPEGVSFGFPRPQRLARVDAADLRKLGFSRQKAEALLKLSRGVSLKEIDLEKLEASGDEEARGKLLQLKGVGPWTADYALLRGLGRLTVFPSGDVGARNRLQSLLRVREPLDDIEIRKRLRAWEPFAGLIYIHLLLSGLADEGCL